MKHVSKKQWNRLDILFNRESRILIHNTSLQYEIEVERRMRTDKKYISWLKRDSPDRYREELGLVEFNKLINLHGYDVLNGMSDASERGRVLHEINLVQRHRAIQSGMDTYTEYQEDLKGGRTLYMCRCGDWYFIKYETDLQRITREIDYSKIKVEKRGGKRTGSGRKQTYGQNEETAVIRIPKHLKDKIKEMLHWLAEHGTFDGTYDLFKAAERYYISEFERCNEHPDDDFWLQQKQEIKQKMKLMNEFKDVIPCFYSPERPEDANQ